MRNTKAFTIVELLIVIVVIAILAAITIVAYNGIKERAHRAGIQSQVNQWDKAFKIYIAERGKRPQGQWACIGKAEDYPAQDGFPAGSCAITSNDSGVTWSNLYTVDVEGIELSDQMAPYVSSKVQSGYDTVTLKWGPTWIRKQRGVVYDDESSGRISLVYTVPGATCVSDTWRRVAHDNGIECFHTIGLTSEVTQWE